MEELDPTLVERLGRAYAEQRLRIEKQHEAQVFGQGLNLFHPENWYSSPWLIRNTLRLLGLRARRPAPFAGAYEPVDAGAGACAYVRGGDVLVVVALRGGQVNGTLTDRFGGTLTDLPRGRWRDVLRGDERSFGQREPVARVVDDQGVAVFERL